MKVKVLVGPNAGALVHVEHDAAAVMALMLGHIEKFVEPPVAKNAASPNGSWGQTTDFCPSLSPVVRSVELRRCSAILREPSECTRTSLPTHPCGTANSNTAPIPTAYPIQSSKITAGC